MFRSSILRKTVLFITLLFVFSYLALCLHMYKIQRGILFSPVIDVNNSDVLSNAGFYPVLVSTKDGIDLNGWWSPSDNAKKIVIYFHGNGQSVSTSYLGVSEFAKRNGYALLMTEYRGFAGHAGAITENGLYLDADSFVQWVLMKTEYKSDDIIFMGGSLGTALAVRMASEYQPYALILFAPFSSILEVAQDTYWFLPVSLLLHDHFRNDLYIRNVDAPVLILHGDKDVTVPQKYARSLFDYAPHPRKEFVSLEGAAHENLFAHGASGYIESFLRSLE